MPQTRIGISGWTYTPWRGTFYPVRLAQKRELEFAARQFNSIEINGTFYSMQRPGYFAAWYAQTPDDFVFAVKGGRFITHMKKLKEVAAPLANFFAQGVLKLGEKLGPILWQFPPGFALDMGRFEAFFELLPRDTQEAAALARGHDARLNGRNWTKTDRRRPLRYAVEIRHPSFLCEPFMKLLRRHKIALCIADTAGLFPYAEDVTADFIYARLHGAEQIYVSGYTTEALRIWADRLAVWRAGGAPADAKVVDAARALKRRAGGRDVYVYFDNDVKVRAPYDAMALADLLDAVPPTRAAHGEAPQGVSEEPRAGWAPARSKNRKKSATGRVSRARFKSRRAS